MPPARQLVPPAHPRRDTAASIACLPRLNQKEEAAKFKLHWSQALEEHFLGKGAFGRVSLIMDKRTGQLFARKVFKRKGAAGAAENNMEEVRAAEWLFQRPHPNVLHPTLAVLLSPSVPRSVHYEHCQMALSDLWAKQEGILSANMARKLGADLCRGLAHLHHYGCIHRDVKPSNLLLQFDEQTPLTLKIGDFGWLTHYQGTPSRGEPKQTSGAVTLPYRPPEILMGMAYGFAVDALGLTAAS